MSLNSKDVNERIESGTKAPVRQLGLTISDSTIGWCLVDEGFSIVDMGVRAFGNGRDPKTGLSLAVERRAARTLRRRRAHYRQRRRAFIAALTAHGLFPSDPSEQARLVNLDPYLLRAAALEGKLARFEVGRALFHLNQRRGFQGSRRNSRWDEESETAIAAGGRTLDELMKDAGTTTYGAYLARQDTRRIRKHAERPKIFPQRRHIATEFDLIWAHQNAFHSDVMTEAARHTLRGILLHQRQARRPSRRPCSYFPSEAALLKAHPLYQEIALWVRINRLALIDRDANACSLSNLQREQAASFLGRRSRCSYQALLRALVDVQPGTRLQSSSTGGMLMGDAVKASLSAEEAFGPQWLSTPMLRQWEIVERLLHEDDHDLLQTYLMSECGLNGAKACKIAEIRLPTGEASFGETAAHLVLAHLKAAAVSLEEAMKRTGLSTPVPSVVTRLPYYGVVLRDHVRVDGMAGDPIERKHGRIMHPSLHIVWRQLEKLINHIIDRFGRPDRIVIEIDKSLKQNRIDRHRFVQRRKMSDVLGSTLIEQGHENSGSNRAKLKLWQELPIDPAGWRRCIYCGEPMEDDGLFNGELTLDRILPFSVAMDDSALNRLVVHERCRREKAGRTPSEAWGHIPCRWEKILKSAQCLSPEKQMRFARDARTRYGATRSTLWSLNVDRHRYAKLTKQYLEALYGPDTNGAVQVVTGKLAQLLSAAWQLRRVHIAHHGEEPNVEIDLLAARDLRERAMTAALVAQISGKLLNSIKRAARAAEVNGLDMLVTGLRQPWPNFKTELTARVATLVASHRPEHGVKGNDKHSTSGRLHNDTAYGITHQWAEDGETPIVAHRIALEKLTPADIAHPTKIRDRALRERLQAVTRGLHGVSYRDALATVGAEGSPWKGLRRLRVEEALNIVTINSADGNGSRSYKCDSNEYWQLWRLPGGSVRASVVSSLAAHTASFDCRPHPAAKRMMRVYKNDVIAIQRDDGSRHLLRVVSMARDGRLTLAGVNDCGNLRARDRQCDTVDPFRLLRMTPKNAVNWAARQVRVDIMGRVFDPGSPN